jgi:hypothetical protein
VGVTGHRVLTDLEPLRAGIEAALDRIEAAFPGQPLTLLSSLAEGADRLAAEAVLRRSGGRLVVPLPLPQAEYETDFSRPQSRAEFRALLGRANEVFEAPHREARNEAYEAAGLEVCRRADVLLAIWDGQASQGRGGTADIVARARAEGKPLVIVRAGNRRAGTQEPTTLGAEQGSVVVETLAE